jgi:probable HAF family extracellular repeat protein
MAASSNSHGSFSIISFPGIVGNTMAAGINDDGSVVGGFSSPPPQIIAHAFVYSNGTYTTIDPPGALSAGANGLTISGRLSEPSPAPLNVQRCCSFLVG